MTRKDDLKSVQAVIEYGQWLRQEMAARGEGLVDPTAPPSGRSYLAKPVKLRDVELRHPQIEEAVQAIKDWADKKREGIAYASILFSGPVGTGKTMLARVLLWSITNVQISDWGERIDGDERPAGRFFKATDLVELLGTHRPGDLVPWGCPLAVIDDIGIEEDIEYIGGSRQAHNIEARYTAFVDHCYTAGVSLIITTNLDWQELADVMGKRAWDRLGEMAPVGFRVSLANVPNMRAERSGRGNEGGHVAPPPNW